MPTNVRDPRTIITPDAFEISTDLLGIPLAAPRKRLWAMLIDLTAIGLLNVMVEGIGLFVWGAVGLFLLRMTFERPPAKNPNTAQLLRLSAGCLGIMILGSVAVAAMVFRLARDEVGGPVGLSVASQATDALGDLGPSALLGGLGVAADLRSADDEDEVEDAALEFIGIADDLNLDEDERRELFMALVPEDADWRGRASDLFDQAVARWDEDEPPSATESAQEAVVADMDDDEVLEAFARRVLEGDAFLTDDDPATAALDRRVIALVAADTLGTLAGRYEDLQDELVSERTRRMEAEAALEQDGSPLVDLMRDIWGQLGSAIGLWSIYFTILLTVLKGQTIGKRIMGIRVLRLDGEPITWWAAFERGGGYIAGLATGLLGFAQVFWDPNRQCIHDKIVGTVVIDDRAERVPGAWKEAALTPRGAP